MRSDRSGVDIPPGLYVFPDRGVSWARWLKGLPELVHDVMGEWQLTVDGRSRHGFSALVVPVLTADRCPSVVKFSWAVDEQEHEHLGLAAWRGDGVVQLLRNDPDRGVMLLERLDADRDLTTVDHVEACAITAGFYQRLHIPALPELRTLSSYIERWTAELAAMEAKMALPGRLVEQAVSLGQSFVADAATDGRIIHGDLHYENVLAAEREPWLVIDPNPMSGDPHYEVAPLLWNRWDDVVATDDVERAVRRRLAAIVEVAGLDEQRARDWTVVRMMHNAMWCLQDHPDGLDADGRWYLAMCLRLTEAVQN